MTVTESASAGRSGSVWRAVALRVYTEEDYCWLCNEFVDQRLHSRHPMSRSADHLIQKQHGGPLNDRANCRLAHLGCNSGRSNALRGLPIDACACSVGYPCARLNPNQPRGYVELDPASI
jgi:hypothetical protein